jgi:ABC-type Fe3+-hydroxamate transport system substrate-binding protein
MAPSALVDATGTTVALAAAPRRIVSLVPSLTETLFALGRAEAMAGCTIFCTEPPDGVARLTRVGGEKNPKLDVIRDLGADLVVANVEENVREHIETLRGWGIAVYVAFPRTVAEGVRLIADLGELTGAAEQGRAMAADLGARLDRLSASPGRRSRVFCPIWRRPYMTINGDTYVSDMIAVCGGDNVFSERASRYPEVTIDDVAAARPDVILLPDEPYRFRRAHIADFSLYEDVPAVQSGRIHLLSGKLLSWYGPRIARALDVLPPLLAGGTRTA